MPHALRPIEADAVHLALLQQPVFSRRQVCQEVSNPASPMQV